MKDVVVKVSVVRDNLAPVIKVDGQTYKTK